MGFFSNVSATRSAVSNPNDIEFFGGDCAEQAEEFFAEHFEHGATGSIWDRVECPSCESTFELYKQNGRPVRR